MISLVVTGWEHCRVASGHYGNMNTPAEWTFLFLSFKLYFSCVTHCQSKLRAGFEPGSIIMWMEILTSDGASETEGKHLKIRFLGNIFSCCLEYERFYINRQHLLTASLVAAFLTIIYIFSWMRLTMLYTLIKVYLHSLYL